MDLEKRLELSFEYARDTTKHLVTLSTGVAAITPAFVKELFQGEPFLVKAIAIAAWILMIASVVCGQVSLMAITGTLATPKLQTAELTIYSRNIKVPSVLQALAFVLGILFFVSATALSLF